MLLDILFQRSVETASDSLPELGCLMFKKVLLCWLSHRRTQGTSVPITEHPDSCEVIVGSFRYRRTLMSGHSKFVDRR